MADCSLEYDSRCLKKRNRFSTWGQGLSRFLQVNRFLVTAAFTGMAVLYLFGGVGIWRVDSGGTGHMLDLLIAAMGTVLSLCALLDARSRFQDYKRAKDLLYKNGFRPRIVSLFIHSRCQRDALFAAARDLGMAHHVRRYYSDKGYRWYHILPDLIFKKPGLLFTFRYWKKTLFAPYYRSKYFL